MKLIVQFISLAISSFLWANDSITRFTCIEEIQNNKSTTDLTNAFKITKYTNTNKSESHFLLCNEISKNPKNSIKKQPNCYTNVVSFENTNSNTIDDSSTTTIIINEIDVHTKGANTLEFIELYDGGAGNSSLDGYILVLYNGKNNLSYASYDLNGFSTNTTGYFVIGKKDVPNLSTLQFQSISIQNGADAIALYKDDAKNFPKGSVISTNNLIDAIVYDTGQQDDEDLLVLLNTNQPQVNENKDYHSLQRIPNGEGGLRNTTSYEARDPSPGTANGIAIPAITLSVAEARAADVYTLVTVTGILTVSDNFYGPAYLQDSTGGIAVFDNKVHANAALKIGDSITITGKTIIHNNQKQIEKVIEVIKNENPNNPIKPVNITLKELDKHPGKLVRVTDVTFPNAGDLLFGSANYTLTDTSGSGELRIDNSVASIVGKEQPITCKEIIGVVGRYNNIYQLMPRQFLDIPCVIEFISPGDKVGYPKEDTFDAVTWNIKWFGDEKESPLGTNPKSDEIQRDSTAVVLKKLNADIYAVQEIADDKLFEDLVSRLPGYAYILSDATSYPPHINPTNTGSTQKVGFIYNTKTVSVIKTRAMFKNIHPYYNGGDTSKLIDYPSKDVTRFFASGRLPFLMTADITINGVTEQIDLIALHARANSNESSQLRYDMRTYDINVLKDSLDTNFKNNKVILLGDYNDDVDETVANITTKVSSYKKYADDTSNYSILSSALSKAGLRSYISKENVIDHITISNELDNAYIENSVSVHYEVYDNDYLYNTSDHIPVSARFLWDKVLKTDDRNTEKAKTLLFPNPVIDHLFIKFNNPLANDVDVVVSDITGKIFFTKQIKMNKDKSESTLDMSSFSKGLYTVKVSDINGEGCVLKKVIKK